MVHDDLPKQETRSLLFPQQMQASHPNRMIETRNDIEKNKSEAKREVSIKAIVVQSDNLTKT